MVQQNAMKHIKTVLFVIVLYSPLTSAAAQMKSLEESSPPKASLDLLISRVDAYWQMLLQGKRSSAAEYVSPADREEFLNLQIAQFSQPQFKSLELSADRTEAKVTTTVKRSLPVGLVNTQVQEKWIFQNNTWYNDFSIAPISVPEERQQSDRSERTGDAKSELMNRIRFEQTVLNFGTVRQGASASLSLKYSLDGEEPLEMGIRKSGPGVQIQGLRNRRLLPGKDRELTVKINSGVLEGDVDESFSLVARGRGVEVPFEFRVQGFVYTPVSIFPKLLEFRSEKKELEKEIRIRNNSKSSLELKSLRTGAGNIAVEPLPATIPAGQELRLKAKQIRDVKEHDIAEFIVIDFAQPVEDMSSIGLNVVINPGPKKRQQSADPALKREIQEILEKYKANQPRR